jgi:universal stress protein A
VYRASTFGGVGSSLLPQSAKEIDPAWQTNQLRQSNPNNLHPLPLIDNPLDGADISTGAVAAASGLSEIIRGEVDMLKPTKILVPTDFSDFSDKALRQALDIAKQYTAKVFLLHVIHEDLHQCVMDYCITGEQIQRMKDQMLAGARESLEKQVAKFPQAKEVEVATDVKLGIPYEAILKEEEERGTVHSRECGAERTERGKVPGPFGEIAEGINNAHSLKSPDGE